MGDSTVWIRAEFNQSSMTVREEAVLKKNGSVGYYSLKLPSPSCFIKCVVGCITLMLHLNLSSHLKSASAPLSELPLIRPYEVNFIFSQIQFFSF